MASLKVNAPKAPKASSETIFTSATQLSSLHLLLPSLPALVPKSTRHFTLDLHISVWQCLGELNLSGLETTNSKGRAWAWSSADTEAMPTWDLRAFLVSQA